MIGYESSLFKAKSDFIEIELQEELMKVPEASSDWWVIPVIIVGLLALIGLIYLITKRFCHGAKKG